MLNAEIHKAEDGTFWTEVAELPGCFASGHTLGELLECVNDAVQLYLDEGDAGSV